MVVLGVHEKRGPCHPPSQYCMPLPPWVMEGGGGGSQ